MGVVCLTFCARMTCARGRVFLDTNSNGMAMPPSPIAGVAVSDGVQVVVSDAQGRFRLDGPIRRLHLDLGPARPRTLRRVLAACRKRKAAGFRFDGQASR